MPEPRISKDRIAAMKSWMAANKEELAARGIDRIDAHYTDDDLDSGAFSETNAYTVTNAGSTFTDVAFTPTAELAELLECLVDGDDVFRGREGGGGTFRLMLASETIEHESFEYMTTRLEHDVEVY